jgi:hypothetical protein
MPAVQRHLICHCTVLTVKRNQAELWAADTSTPAGRTQISHFFSDYLANVPSGQSGRYANRNQLRYTRIVISYDSSALKITTLAMPIENISISRSSVRQRSTI